MTTAPAQKSRSARFLAALAFCSLFLLTTTSALASVGCIPSFDLQAGVQNGWMGADAAYSVPLPHGNVLWIFGDTLLGPQRSLAGGEPRMTRNSLGLSHCDDGLKWRIRYIVPHDDEGAARSVFTPTDSNHWYWPMDGFLARRRLWVTLLCLRHPQPRQPQAFDFESCGVDLASFPISADLAITKPTLQPFSPAGSSVSMSSAVVTQGPFVYFFGIRESPERPLLLSRVRRSHLADAEHWQEFLANDNTWQRKLQPNLAKVLFQPGATEMSVRYHSEWHVWLAVYKDSDLLSDRVLARFSPTLSGPWSSASELFSIRALDAAASRPGVFCYAGKEHPEFAGRGELMVTYVCNAKDPASLLQQEDIYVPQIVKVKLDQNLHVIEATRLLRSTPTHTESLPGQTAATPDGSFRPTLPLR